MQKLQQTILHDDPQGREGNCWQTVLACVLDLELDEVPHFVQIDVDTELNWFFNTYKWCEKRGLSIVGTPNPPETDDYILVVGKSPRGDFSHVVIYKDGKMFHDPHPSGEGLATQDDFYLITQK